MHNEITRIVIIIILNYAQSAGKTNTPARYENWMPRAIDLKGIVPADPRVKLRFAQQTTNLSISTKMSHNFIALDPTTPTIQYVCNAFVINSSFCSWPAELSTKCNDLQNNCNRGVVQSSQSFDGFIHEGVVEGRGIVGN